MVLRKGKEYMNLKNGNCMQEEISMNKADAKTAMEELSMILIYLSHFTERDRFADPNSKYAWKGYGVDILNQLDEKDYIRRG